MSLFDIKVLRRIITGKRRWNFGKIPGIYEWWHADYNVILDGGEVSSWVGRVKGKDLAGVGGAGTRPTMSTVVDPGGKTKTCLNFDGTEYLRCAFGAGLSQPLTVLMMVTEIVLILGDQLDCPCILSLRKMVSSLLSPLWTL